MGCPDSQQLSPAASRSVPKSFTLQWLPKSKHSLRGKCHILLCSQLESSRTPAIFKKKNQKSKSNVGTRTTYAIHPNPPGQNLGWEAEGMWGLPGIFNIVCCCGFSSFSLCPAPRTVSPLALVLSNAFSASDFFKLLLVNTLPYPTSAALTHILFPMTYSKAQGLRQWTEPELPSLNP